MFIIVLVGAYLSEITIAEQSLALYIGMGLVKTDCLHIRYGSLIETLQKGHACHDGLMQNCNGFQIPHNSGNFSQVKNFAQKFSHAAYKPRHSPRPSLHVMKPSKGGAHAGMMTTPTNC